MSNRAIEQLVDEANIQRVLTRYAEALDTRDWESLQQVFTSDATAYYEGIGRFDGRDAIVDLVSSVLAKCGPTQHLLGTIRIEVDGTIAKAKSYLQAIHAGINDYQGSTLTVWGEYRDQLRRTEHGWRIEHRELASLHASGDIGIG